MRVWLGSCLAAFCLMFFQLGAPAPRSQLNLPFNIDSGDFNTGIAVVNPGDASGAIRFKLSRTLPDGTVESFEVTSSDLAGQGVGSGLLPDGQLAGGGTYSVLASDLGQVVGVQDFSGQLSIKADFADAGAVNFVFNSGFSAVHGFTADRLGEAPAILPDQNLPPLIWPVKFSCGYLSQFKLGIWLTSIQILNPSEQAVELTWKAQRDDGVLSQGTTNLGPDGVLDISCFDDPYKLDKDGYIQITAKSGDQQRPLQVVSAYKNLEFSEIKTQKGYQVFPTSTFLGFAYSSEFLCGNTPRVRPDSMSDILEILDVAEVPFVWRPGAVATRVFVSNPTSEVVSAVVQIRDSDNGGGSPVLSRSIDLQPREVRRYECSDVEDAIEDDGTFFGWFAVGSVTDRLAVTFNQTDYNTTTDGSLHIEYVQPIQGQIDSQP